MAYKTKNRKLTNGIRIKRRGYKMKGAIKMQEERKKLIVVLLIACVFCSPAWADWSTPIPLDEINTSDNETGPCLSHDGLTLYFVGGPSSSSSRIFEANRPQPFGPFTQVREVTGLEAGGDDIYGPCISPDNLRMYYTEQVGSTYLIKVGERTSVDDPWSAGIDISELSSLGNVQNPSVSYDELTIFFDGYNLPGGMGGWDIWQATRANTSSPFGNVTNIAAINSSSVEVCPSTTTDGLTIYFSSDRNGQSQIFKATRPSVGQSFGTPEHLSVIDTPDGSAAPSISSDDSTIYFRRHDSGLGTGDIYVSYREPNLVAHWKFDEGSGPVAYDSVGINHGIVYGPAWVEGADNGALDFDGMDDYVEVSDSDVLDITDKITLSAWIKPDSISGIQFVVTKWGIDDIDCSYGLRLEDADVRFFLVNGSSMTAKTYTDLTVSQNDWSYITATWDGQTMRAYLNGTVSDQNEIFVAGINVTDEPVSIGFNPGAGDGAGGGYFNGTIDDVRIYDRALTDVEILQLYEAVIPPPLPPFTYYVDGVNGSNLNDGLTLATAFATIEQGLLDANDGDTVLVYPDVYSEELNFDGENIILQGVPTADGAPILEAPSEFAIITMYSGEDANAIVSNLVIRNTEMAMFLVDASPTIQYLTIVDNETGIGAYGDSDPDISNCIFYNNSLADLYLCQARHSFVSDGNSPLFVDDVSDDYHLKSIRGRHWPTHDVWVLDDVSSPCIDLGDPNIYPENEPDPNGGRINVGVFANTEYASMSEWRIPEDQNRDGIVNFNDIALTANRWLERMGWYE